MSALSTVVPRNLRRAACPVRHVPVAGAPYTEWVRRGRLGGRSVGRLGPRRAGAARDLALVLGQDDPLHPLAGLGVERVGDVLERAVLATLGGHRDEQPGVSVD